MAWEPRPPHSPPRGSGVSISPVTPSATQPGAGMGLCPGGCGVSFGPLSSEDPGLGTSGQERLHGQRLAHTQAPLGRGLR